MNEIFLISEKDNYRSSLLGKDEYHPAGSGGFDLFVYSKVDPSKSVLNHSSFDGARTQYVFYPSNGALKLIQREFCNLDSHPNQIIKDLLGGALSLAAPVDYDPEGKLPDVYDKWHAGISYLAEQLHNAMLAQQTYCMHEADRLILHRLFDIGLAPPLSPLPKLQDEPPPRFFGSHDEREAIKAELQKQRRPVSSVAPVISRLNPFEGMINSQYVW